MPVTGRRVPFRRIDRATLFLVPHVEVVALERSQVALGLMRDILLADLFDIKEASVLLQGRIGLDPSRRIGGIIFLGGTVYTAVELRIGNNTFFDLAGLLVQPPCQRR